MGGETPLIGVPIYDFLAEVAARHGDGEAVVSRHQGLRLTYADFFRQVDRLARGLAALGVRRGTRVGIWAVNNVEWVVLQIATARVGAVLVNVNPAYRSAELEHAMTAARVEILFLMPSFKTSRYAEMVRRLCPEVETQSPDELRCARLPELRRLVVFDPDDVAATRRPAPGFLTWPEVLERGDKTPPGVARPELDPDDPINIQFTSGTTGFAKPVVLTHHGLLNNALLGGRGDGPHRPRSAVRAGAVLPLLRHGAVEPGVPVARRDAGDPGAALRRRGDPGGGRGGALHGAPRRADDVRRRARPRRTSSATTCRACAPASWPARRARRR